MWTELAEGAKDDRQGDRLTANSGEDTGFTLQRGKATAGFQHSTDREGLHPGRATSCCVA